MEKWQTSNTINLLYVLNANIQNSNLNEICIENPPMLEYHDQIEIFLQPFEIDDIPC
jgi:hypothetical protein